MGILDKLFATKTSSSAGSKEAFDPSKEERVPEKHANLISETIINDAGEKTETWVQGHVRKLPSKGEMLAADVSIGRDMQKNHMLNDGDGSRTPLGYGFASSSALTERGFTEGSKIRNIDDLNMSLELLTCEYLSHIQSKLDSLESKSNAHMQNWSRMAGVSEAHDSSMKKVLEQIHEQMQKFRTELSKIEEGKGMVQGIHIAYKRGYVQAIELAGHIQYYDAKAER